MSKNKVFILIDIRNEWVTWIVKHLRSPVALLDRCCRVPFWRKVGEISRRWQFCDMKNATKYLVVGSLGVLMTRRDISGLAVKGLKRYRIRPNHRPCPHNPPPPTFYFIFTYYHPLHDLCPDFLLYFHLLSPTSRSLSWLFTLFSLIITHFTIFFLTFYFIFTYYRPLDDLLALVVENKFTQVPRAPIRSNTVIIY